MQLHWAWHVSPFKKIFFIYLAVLSLLLPELFSSCSESGGGGYSLVAACELLAAVASHVAELGL